MIILMWLFQLLPPTSWVMHVYSFNQAMVQAQGAYQGRQFRQAAQYYQFGLDTLGLPVEAAQLNLAHSLWQSGQSQQAQEMYARLQQSANSQIKALALNQLGVLEAQAGNVASSWFRQALIADPSLEEARFNYELAVRLEPEEPETSPFDQEPQQGEAEEGESQGQKSEQQQGRQSQGDDQQLAGAGSKKTPSWQDRLEESAQPDGTGPDEAGPEEEAEKGKGKMQVDHEQLKKMQLTEEQARQLLETLRRQEIQYLQQMQKPASGNKRRFKTPY